jgi:hypothetical protein
MDKAFRHIVSELVAAKPGLDGRTTRGFTEQLVKEAKESFPQLTMDKVCKITKKRVEKWITIIT